MSPEFPLLFIQEYEGMLEIPDNKALLPPGYYMLFLLDDCDVPSIARFIHVY